MALTPMMNHYLTTKENYKDCVLMYRLGDFYEMFFDDAVKVSEALDLVLTGRDCGLDKRAPMCGIPHHAVESYIAKLIGQGFKVAVCEQLTLPDESKGMVERGVVRVVTAGTVTEEQMLDASQNNFLAGVVLRAASCSTAWADISTGDFFTAEFTGEDSVAKMLNHLVSICPKEIICNKEAEKFNETAIVRQNILPRFSCFSEFNFNALEAKEILFKQFSVKSLQSMGIDENSLSALSCALLVKYFIKTQFRMVSHLKPIKCRELSEFMKLDTNTKTHLELFLSNHDRKRKGSLIWLLDQTKTPMGSRMLNSWMLNPLQDAAEIKKRLDAVDEFVKDFLFREELKGVLAAVKDIERLAAKISCDRLSPRDCNALQSSLYTFPKLKSLLSQSKTLLLRSLAKEFPDLSEAEKLLADSIMENAPPTAREGSFIKDGFDKTLDECRYLSSHGKQMLAGLEAKEKNSSGIKNLKIGYNRVFGYFFEVTNSYKDMVPLHFMRKQTLVGSERYITDDLKQLEEAILGAEERGLRIEKELFCEICQKLLAFIPSLQAVAAAIASADCLLSFATVAVNNNFSKPEITTSERLEISQGRHPIVEHYLKKGAFVPNDTMLDTGQNRTIVLTGPNMAGKSTFMRQTAIIAYLAHIGSFVPASSASVPIIDQIFTRVGASDDIAFSQSTFMAEMTEAAYILNNATQKSLIVLDEIGRGTSTFDGLSIAWAILEYLTKNIKAKTLFATHFHELTELEGNAEGIKNFKISVSEFNGTVVFLYKIARGAANKSFGIEVAGLAGVKEEILQNARKILSGLEAGNTAAGTADRQLKPAADKKAAEVKRILNDIDINKCSPIDAFEILKDLVEKVKDN